MAKRSVAVGAITAILTIMVLSNSSPGWSQDRVPIGTVPLFPPTSGTNNVGNETLNDSLVQFDLGEIELSRNVKATGIEGRLAVRSGLHITVTDSSPQMIHIPVQLFGDSVLGSLSDTESDVYFDWDDESQTGELSISFASESVQGLATITTGQMLSQPNSVAAEVISVRFTVGEYDLGTDTQIGGSADIEFVGSLVPDVFLVGLRPISTAEVASIWSMSRVDHDGLALIDVLASVSIEAGFIGQFDGDPQLNIQTDASWRSSVAGTKMYVLGLTITGETVILVEHDYSIASSDEMDVFSFAEFSDLSSMAIVLADPENRQPIEPTPATLEPVAKSPTISASVVPLSSVVSDPVTSTPEPEPSDKRGSSRWMIWVAIGGVALLGIVVYMTFVSRRSRA